MTALARESGLPVRPGQAGKARDDDEWVEAVAASLGVEVEAAELPYAEVERQLRSAGPAILRIPGAEGPRFLALMKGRRRVTLLGPDLTVRRLKTEVVRTALCQPLETPLLSEVDQMLNRASVPKRRQTRARQAILGQRLGGERVSGCWLLRLPPGASLWLHLRQAHFPSRLALLGICHTVQYGLWILSWWMVGQGALQGRLDHAWLLAWALILFTLVPFRLLTTWLEGFLAIGIGSILKQRLLAGALHLEPEEIRHQGAGQLLGQVMESEAVESLALSGGLLGLVAGIEILMAAPILGAGAGGWAHVIVLFVWAALAVLLAWRYFRNYRDWTGPRLKMTHDLVEVMVGHRTRLAQQAPERWHEGEDQALERYLERSKGLDRSALWLLVLIPHGWLAVGILALAPAFVSGSSSPTWLAVGVGGTLLAHRALKRLVSGLQHVVGAYVSWEQVAPLARATSRSQSEHESPFPHVTVSGTNARQNHTALLEGHDLTFRYPHRAAPALHGCSLQIVSGERLLLEGPSGGGKSTLASLLTGLRRPQSGLLLLDGLDRQTTGSLGWRKRVAAAPQFHENYVLTGTFSFNLLMGRRWPPRAEDLEEAETICHQLGLDSLLERMPAGMLQMVGESGWQLSHGERSRLYIARALLQGSELVVLDESLAALDPETLRQSVRCVLDHAPTLLVIAHP